MALGYTDYEEGFRHGKRDYCAGIRSQALLNNPDRYSEGYRAGITMFLEQSITTAIQADKAFDNACKAEGWKSRWDMSVTPQHSQFLRDAYFAKIDADKAMHDAFVKSRA